MSTATPTPTSYRMRAEPQGPTPPHRAFARPPVKATTPASAVPTVANSGGPAEVDGGVIRGYLVRFGGPGRTDSVGDYFDRASTDFWRSFPSRAPVLYHHGKDPALGLRRLGEAELEVDAEGIAIAFPMKARDAYERAILDLAREGALGWSSGASAHMVARERQPNGAKMLASWNIAEASLTPCPCEPRASAVFSLKALPTLEDEADALGLAAWVKAQLELRKRWLRNGGSAIDPETRQVLARARRVLADLDRADRLKASLEAIDRRAEAFKARQVFRSARRTIAESEARERRARLVAGAPLRRTIADARRTLERTAPPEADPSWP